MRSLYWIVMLLLVCCNHSRLNVVPRTQDFETDSPGYDATGNLSTTSSAGKVKSEILEPARIPVDILVVVDVSPSMPPENIQLLPQIMPLVRKFTQYDWQLAITTSIGSDCLRALIKKTPLLDMALLGHAFVKATYSWLDDRDKKASVHEEVMKMATRAISNTLPLRKLSLRCTGAAKPWIRNDSMLAIVLVTDEDVDDQHHPADKRCINGSCINMFWTQLQKIRSPHITSRIYGLLNDGQDRSGIDSPGREADTNTGYVQWRSSSGEQLFDVHKPLVHSNDKIKSDDVLEIADNFRQWLEKYFIIRGIVSSNSTIKVTYTKGNTRALMDSEYSIEGNVLILSNSVASGVKSIAITY